ncbi:hypothetical protein FRC05_005812 [Tulasnella sp. 425]|nr:hypothetical protein FRC05_005812 [Tulasnella sp. 425]
MVSLRRSLSISKVQFWSSSKEVINTMVEHLAECASDVTRVSDEVSTQGKLGGQVSEVALGGTWQELCRTVNKLTANLTNQVRAIAQVTKAVALGDLSKMIEVGAQGEVLELKTTANGMVIRLRKLAEEVWHVSLELGTLGNLGGQADVPDVEGLWWQLTNNVNKMCLNLTQQVRSIATVTTAVAKGDLTQHIEIEVEGEMATLKNTVNSMVQQLNTFASEVTRVALEVGTMGVLGGQAQVEGVKGTWADLTNNVNKMAENLTAQVRSIANVTKAVASGDRLQQTVQVDVQGEMLDLKNTVNSMVRQLYTLANKVTRVSLEVGMEGKLGGQAMVEGVEGMWEVLMNNVNMTALNLTTQVRSIAEVTKAVAQGDLTMRIEVDVKEEILELKQTVNGMTESLSTFAAEVTCVAREVGTEGKLGGRASVPGVSGTWKDLTENVNNMALNTTVTRGDLTQKCVGVSVAGEILDLVSTINSMIDQLAVFATEVMKVAREVGTEGKLGVQAESHIYSLPPAFDADRFTQISAAATDGDFTRFITVKASGEMDSLKTQINQMVYNLRESIQKNTAAREAAELANRSKSEFLAYMSHEIRFGGLGLFFISHDVIRLADKSRIPHVDTIIVDSLAGTEKLRDLDHLRYIPIILLSPPLPPHCMSRLNLKWCLDNSISAQLTTPCNHEDLANTLVTALESITSHQANVAVKLLENYGHHVQIVENGQLAVDAVKERWHQGKPYDVILFSADSSPHMGVSMPFMGGMEATELIRAFESEQSLERTPIIALTAHAMIGDHERCLQAGMDDRVTKPLHRADLTNAISKLVRPQAPHAAREATHAAYTRH